MEVAFKVLCMAMSYFIGACPTAFITGKLVKNIDIREYGSGNVGATNVFRVVGKKWGIFVLIVDILKGVCAVVIWQYVDNAFDGPELSRRFLFICGIIAILGHNWTIFLNFKGGKGVATTLGVLLGLFPVSVSIAAAVAFTLIGITHYVSIGSIVGAIIFPIIFVITNHGMPDFAFFMIVICIIAIMIIIKHKTNIRRLLKGEENKAF
ncbi:MAG: glycerol-3-phosphate 1-O-acyltransferase PlsY [Candidatus Omnitrophica bacterium]|nr:glycerol-3-phosphate 1-O-acyltransferase PlsY [Candidatus Omnitrophota bacterium]